MNKYTLYLPLFFALFALAGCEKEHTGYLFTENARYPIDSLKIIRYEDYSKYKSFDCFTLRNSYICFLYIYRIE